MFKIELKCQVQIKGHVRKEMIIKSVQMYWEIFVFSISAFQAPGEVPIEKIGISYLAQLTGSRIWVSELHKSIETSNSFLFLFAKSFFRQSSLQLRYENDSGEIKVST